MRRLTGLALLLALWPMAPASAQSARLDEAVATVQSHFRQNTARFDVSAADLADLDVARAYVGRRSGVAHVYLRQRHAGVPVFNAPASAHLGTDGTLHGVHARFVDDLAARANAPEPAISAEAAAQAAAQHLLRTESTWRRPATTFSDAPGEGELPADYLLPSTEHAALYYFVTEGGPVRLAWNVAVDTRDGAHSWTLRVDAQTGTVLDLTDHVDHDNWGLAARAPINLAPLAAASAPAASGTYRVVAVPFESPNHGPRSLVVTPHDPPASQLGWHNTGTNSFTITRGNNVYAYTDVDANNSPDPGSAPDGGAGLVFDFPFDDVGQTPPAYRPAAVTNLFYWNNIIHDVLWHYGFDEAAGNFQTNNFGQGGNGNDPVLAEAQDGSGTDNANFNTPSDGSSPRMQMFEWTGVPGFTITAPPEIAGEYLAGGAAFGVQTSVSAEMAIGADEIGDPRACEGVFTNVAGKIALIERGGCNFVVKARAAQAAGAVAVVIYNCLVGSTGCSAVSESEVITMGCPVGETCTDVTIPALFVQRATGLLIVDHLPGVTAAVGARPNRDSDFDNGVIAHEYGHGISNRLTGSGPGCLNNGEQMGEGWSDYYGMMLTQQPGDTATEPRGVGTYVAFQPVTGPGIRPTAYSTDFAINGTTYGDLPTLVAPHGVGYAWATMLWEMTWDLIAAHGYSPNLYDATGTAGNQIAMNLVTEGMAIQPCSPGFVDGRNAIIAADQALYGGAHFDTIWLAFARRGLGFAASQGSSNSSTDGVEDFTVPPGVGVEDGADVPTAYRLSQAYPNPFNPSAQFTLELAQPQAVRVELFDALGRSVAMLHDGELAAGATRFTIDGTGLASGLYLYRVTGATFTETRRVSLLK